MNPAAGKGIEIAGQSGDQGLAFASFHLSNLTFMQHHPANQLHIEMAHAENPLACFTHHSEGLRKDLIENGRWLAKLPAFARRSWNDAVLSRS